MAWLEDSIREGRVPTTYEMDEVDPNDPNWNTVMILCNNDHWNRWENYEAGESKRRRCTEVDCDVGLFDIRSLVSLRTWNPKRKRRRGE